MFRRDFPLVRDSRQEFGGFRWCLSGLDRLLAHHRLPGVAGCGRRAETPLSGFCRRLYVHNDGKTSQERTYEGIGDERMGGAGRRRTRKGWKWEAMDFERSSSARDVAQVSSPDFVFFLIIFQLLLLVYTSIDTYGPCSRCLGGWGRHLGSHFGETHFCTKIANDH